MPAGRPPRLYDLAVDAGEKYDIASDRPGDVARLAVLWNDWNAENPPEPNGIDKHDLKHGRSQVKPGPVYQIVVP